MAIFASNLAPASTDRALGSAVIERSLRFNNYSQTADDATLTRTVSTTSNRRTFTHSFWVKRTRLGYGMIFGHTDTSGAYFFNFVFNSDNKIEFNEYRYNESPSNKIRLITTRLFRDVTSWYHIVTAVDTTQGTAANRVKIYVNGVQETAFDTAIYCDQNHDTYFNSTSPYPIMRIGLNGWGYGGANCYLAEFNAVDGYAYDPSYFGFTDSQTGLWMPKRYEGTYGTNGYRLDFSDNSSTSALGIDKSPNGNDFTVTNFSVSAGEGNDSVIDTPTKKFPTLNALDKASTISLKNGNLQIDDVTNQNYDGVRATFGTKTGKYYWEIKFPTTGYLSAIGIARADGYIYTASEPTYRIVLGLGSWYNTYNSGGVATYVNATPSADYPSVATWSGASNYSNNDVYMIAVDFDNGKMWWGKNNSWFNNSGTANPATGTDPRITFTTGNEWFPYSQEGDSSTSPQAYNFGQQGFAYTPPSGFLALSSENLPPNVPSIVRPQRHFTSVLYVGAGSGTQRITSLEFQPDFVWIKGRTNGWHILTDSVRGAGKIIASNSTDAEDTSSGASTAFQSFDISGFTVGYNTGWYTNGSGSGASQNQIGWCWKAGGAAVSNSDGSITSSISANQEAGFSIVTWTGNGSSGATIGHGLGAAPKFIITKRRTVASHWAVYHHSIGTGSEVYLDLNQAKTDSNFWVSTPTSSVFTVSGADYVNTSGNTYLAYCWSEVPGYSKIGLYKADGLSDGPYIRCGFRPAWILIKNTSLGQPWVIMDNKINPYNLADTRLQPNSANGDHTSGDNYIDFLADGFKIRSGSSTDINYSTSYTNHIFIAFAEQPGEIPFDTFANAR